jgi:flavin-dependent dehydrogenase
MPSHVEVHWGRLGQAYITPTAPGEICVSVMTRNPSLRLDPILAALPSLRDRLRGAEPLAAERGCLTVTQRLPSVTRGNVSLIGDASGSVDAITGEGLALAFQQAILLSQSLACESLELYEARHPALLALPQRMASMLLLLDRHPQLCARTLRAFAAHPALFRALLAVHVGEASLAQFLLQNGMSLAAGLLAAQAALPPETPASA